MKWVGSRKRWFLVLDIPPHIPIADQATDRREVRYSRTLERLLGGPETVVAALEAVQHLAEGDG